MVLLVLASASRGEDRYARYVGSAYAPGSKRILYHEEHVLLQRDGTLAERIVLYRCPNGTPFARKVSQYDALLAPDVALENGDTGMQQGVRHAQGMHQVYFRASRGEPEKSAPLPNDPSLVIDAGFDEFIRANWRALLDGKTIPLHFLVQSRLEAMNFKVYHLHSERTEDAAVETFRLKLDGVVGWVLPSIDVSYSSDEHVLMRYTGLSDLRDSHGDNYRAEIVFRNADRAPATAADARAARAVPLGRCR